MSTDEQLVEEFQRGSREAFAELSRRYRDKMYGFFRRRTANPARLIWRRFRRATA